MLTFDEAWDKKLAQGYRYGSDALSNVRLGWQMHEEAVGAHIKTAVLAALKPGNGLPELPTTQMYTRLCDMPPDVLASRVVETLIRCKGNLNEYAKIIEALIVAMREEAKP